MLRTLTTPQSAGAPAARRTYLDDPERVWELEPNASHDLVAVMDVLRGALGLLEHCAGTPAQCLDTALTWLAG